ncbi:MAG: LuxR C-terminal-related transcriptional regulator [Gammaproteobacteria bacterium]|nr:LuxR C-terminal-related transcriptional regulator [Gammaproteobacteria bacterium]
MTTTIIAPVAESKILNCKKTSDSPFTKDTSFKLLGIIESLDYLSTREEFVDVIRDEIRRLIPHDMSIFGIGEWKTFRVDAKINIDYCEKYLKTIMDNTDSGQHVNSPVVREAAKASNFVEVKVAEHYAKKNPDWAEAVRKFGIHNLYGKGRKHPGGTRYTFHCYTNNHLEWDDQRRRIVNIITPHIDNAMLRIFGMETINKTIEITLREQEILQHIQLGLKNEDIARQLNISTHTVKNHIKSILAKLKVKNRTEAVAKAIDFDLIQA